MKLSPSIDSFTYISDATDRIDQLVEQAKHSRGSTKQGLLVEAQSLMDAYEAHCRKGGNDKKQFNPVI